MLYKHSVYGHGNCIFAWGILGQKYSKVGGKDYEMRIHVIVLIAVTILNIVHQLFVGLKVINIVSGRYLNAEYFYDSAIEILWITLLFLLC